MNKAQLISAVGDRAGLSNKMTGACLDALVDVVCEQLGRGEAVSYPGFLKIARVDRKPRTGRNPKTGEPVDIPATTGVKVQAGSRLKVAARG